MVVATTPPTEYRATHAHPNTLHLRTVTVYLKHQCYFTALQPENIQGGRERKYITKVVVRC